MKIMYRIVLPLFIFMIGCLSQDPSDVQLHAEECTYCKMVISDARFPSQLVSEKGKSYPFDSIECMAAYQQNNPEIAENARFYVTDFTAPGTWILVEEAEIYQAEDLQSPMGLSLFALRDSSNMPEIVNIKKQLTWQQTLEIVSERWENK